MKNRTITSIFGVIGILLWTMTIFLRETTLIQIVPFRFILGIMPNIAAGWVFIYAFEVMMTRLNKRFDFNWALKVSVWIVGLAFVSEIVHDLFLDSPFDIYDMIATLLALGVYLIIFKKKQI